MSPIWKDRGWRKPGKSVTPPERNLVAEHAETLAPILARVHEVLELRRRLIYQRASLRSRLKQLRANAEHGTTSFRKDGHATILRIQDELAKIERDLASLAEDEGASWL